MGSFDWSFKLTKKTKLDAQNYPRLQTFAFDDIFVNIQSICAFIVIMKVVGFVLDYLHGIGDVKTFTNGRMTLMVRVVIDVWTTTKFVWKYNFKSYEKLDTHNC